MDHFLVDVEQLDKGQLVSDGLVLRDVANDELPGGDDCGGDVVAANP